MLIVTIKNHKNSEDKNEIDSPQFEQRWTALDKPPGQMAVAKLEHAGESWERVKQEAFRRKANVAVRAFRVNRDSGAMVGLVHYAGTTDQPENGGGAGSDTPLWRK